jgi:hypothetical protein
MMAPIGRRARSSGIGELLETLEELIAEYSAFQRSRPDLGIVPVPVEFGEAGIEK